MGDGVIKEAAGGKVRSYFEVNEYLARRIQPAGDERDFEQCLEDLLANQRDGEFFIVLDGPPAATSGRFVEVEDAEGHGVGDSTGADWADRGDGYWTLGPFGKAASNG